jgi:hypothetical protein
MNSKISVLSRWRVHERFQYISRFKVAKNDSIGALSQQFARRDML